uniref:Uncharacterized protein n=1 Tax=viral metagenome TaxID=1070528 RepID=A0A6C0IA94_9ZZZZ
MPHIRRNTRKSRKHRLTRRKSYRMKRGGGLREDADSALTSYVKEHNISKYDFFMNMLNKTKTNPNPIAIGNFVFRLIGHRDYYLQARPLTDEDTPEALRAMANVSDNVYIDNNNKDKYVTVMQISDR